MTDTMNPEDRKRIAQKFDRLVEIMAVLRSPGGCEWDRAQDHNSLRPYLIEETYEALDALERNNDEAFCEELGDILLQIIFHSRMAEEREAFSIEQTLNSIIAKMLRRHPHVFGGETAPTPEEALSKWHKKKIEEKLKSGKAKNLTEALSSIPENFPALMRAQRFGEKVAPYGFDWEKPDDVFEKIEEEYGELKDALESGDINKIAEELGDVFFVLVQLTRKLKLDAEQCLTGANRKFLARFSRMEKLALEKYCSNNLSLEQWDSLWEEAKKTP